MNKIKEALNAVKIRIAFIGHPNEPKDWSKEIALIEAALLESEPTPAEITKEKREVLAKLYLENGTVPTPAMVIALKACDEIDHLTIENQAKDEKIAKLSQYGDWHSKTRRSMVEAKREIEKLYRKRGEKLKQVEAQNTKLKEYARHKDDCNLLSLIPCTKRNGKTVGCDCGFSKL